MKKHNYQITIEWTGNQGTGTSDYKSYNRNHKISSEGKYDKINGSSDPSFLGDKTKYNPEDLFLSSLSSCHMLWYLHLCATNKIVITEYVDNARGVMEIMENGIGKFVEVTLYPTVKIENAAMISKANELHAEATKMCFIANSCNFKVKHNPTTTSD
jgi:organic hydroperoxide reductase OsmC/OhrA